MKAIVIILTIIFCFGCRITRTVKWPHKEQTVVGYVWRQTDVADSFAFVGVNIKPVDAGIDRPDQTLVYPNYIFQYNPHSYIEPISALPLAVVLVCIAFSVFALIGVIIEFFTNKNKPNEETDSPANDM